MVAILLFDVYVSTERIYLLKVADMTTHNQPQKKVRSKKFVVLKSRLWN